MNRGAGDLLIRDLSAGHEAAFATLYDRFGPSLFRVALSMLGLKEDAEDAVQEVFVSLVRGRQKLAGVENLRAYLFASLRHAALKLSAAGKLKFSRQPSDLESIPAGEHRTAMTDRSARLEQALDRLPPEQRELVALKIDGGLTFAEIGVLLGISPNTAAGRYRYALEKLRDALQGVDG
jgi:RNA polymerase sigma-70 factor, ECF subfamily